MRFSRFSFGATAVAIALAFGMALPAESLQAQVAKRAYVSPSVMQAFEAGGPRETDQRVRVIVTFETARGAAVNASEAEIGSARSQVLAALPAGSYEVVSTFKRVRAVSLSINEGALGALRAHPRVQSVNLDREVFPHMLDANAVTGVGAAHTAGLTGAGVRVAVIDSGVDTDHPALADDLIAQACFRTEGDCPAGPNVAEDQGGHGTHVAGIITGPNGAAPDAEFASLKVFTTGSTSDTNIINALDFVITNSGGAGLDFDLVNMSLGGGLYADQASCDADSAGYVAAMATLNANGVTLFVSTGNDAEIDLMGSPGCATGAVGVGSSGDAVFNVSFAACTDNAQPDKLSCYSNATPVQGPGELVDIVAPGCFITSTGLSGSTTTNNCGTSMSSPYAAGIAAVVTEYLNDNSISMTPAQLEEHLEATGTMISDYRMAALPGGGPLFPRVNPNNALGALELDAPTGFTATEIDDNTVDTDWTAAVDATEYRVYRSVNDGPFELAGTVPAPTVTFTDTAVPCGELTYHVRSFDGTFESLPSNEDSETPRACPLAPTNLSLVGNGDVSVDLTWEDNSADETGFTVERSLNGGAFAEIVAVAADVETATDNAPVCGLLDYRVAAVRGTDLSEYSNVVSYVPCGPDNDLFANAEETDGGAADGDTADYVDTEAAISFATESPDDPLYSCGFFGEAAGFNGVWYSITPTEPVRVTIDTNASTGASDDTLLSVLTHDGTDFTEIACSEDEGDGLLSIVTVNLNPGQTYYAFVSQFAALTEGDVASLVTTFAFESGSPVIDVTPVSLSASSEPDTETTQTLTIGNTGGGPLTWNVSEAENLRPGQPYVYGLPGAGAYASPVGADRAAGSSPSGAVTHVSNPAPQGTGPITGDFSEGFDDITLLPGAGWAFTNLSSPLGTTTWFQGNPTVFPAFEGAVNTSYIGANFNATTGNNTISNWLITPEMELLNGTEITFYSRIPTAPPEFPDRLEVRLSTAGASTNVGATNTSVGDFTTVLLTINPTLANGVYPQVWTQFTATLSGIAPGTTGRIAFRYFVTSGGPSGANSNFIGIDSFAVDQPQACDTPSDLPWVSVSPANGVTNAGETSDVSVTFDSTGLAADTYSGQLCIASDDPANPVVQVPVSLEVVAAPRIEVDVASIDGTAPAGGSGSAPLVISNVGDAELTWDIAESDVDPRPGQGYQYGLAGGTAFVSAVGADRASGASPTGPVMHSVDAAPQGVAPISTDFAEGFDDITVLPGAGWSLQNLSSPLGGTSWFQGNPAVFEAFDGAATNSYIGANFNNTTGAGTIDNWLISPHVELNNGTVISFYTRVPTDTAFPDRLEVRLSTAGASTSVADFSTLVTTINPDLNIGGGPDAYPEVWTQVSFTVEGLPSGATGRVAMRYFVTSGGPAGDNSSYIGIDAFNYVAGDPSFCESPSDFDWLSVNPATGATNPGQDSPVSVDFDATDLAVGTYNAQLCIDSNDNSNPRIVVPVELVVTQAELDLSPATLPDGAVNEAYSATLTATGDTVTPPITFAVTSVEGLPPGLTLFSNGNITGTPTTAGSYTFTITATDSADPAAFGSLEYTVVIAEADPVIEITPASVPRAQIDTPYSVQFVASGSGALEPFTFSFTGALPAGVTLDANGLLSGTPSELGTFNFTVTAEDSSPPVSGGPFSASVDYTLIVVDEFIFADGFETADVLKVELESSGMKRVSLPVASELAFAGDRQQPIMHLLLKGQLVGVVEARCAAKACEVRVATRAGDAKWNAGPWWALDSDPYTIEVNVGTKLLRSVTPAAQD